MIAPAGDDQAGWRRSREDRREAVLDWFGGSAEDIRNALIEAYAEDTIGRILHYVADRGLAEAKKQLTDRALTIGAHGFENVQAKIEEFIRTSAGRGVVTTGAA